MKVHMIAESTDRIIPSALSRIIGLIPFLAGLICRFAYCLTSVATEMCGQSMLRKFKMTVCVY
jgi:hypothetical protein